jgi:transketolase
MQKTTPMPTTRVMQPVSVDVIREKAARLRIDSVLATTEAGSGHPTSCASAAEIAAVLFYSVMRYDPRNPKRPDSDVFVLSKGHAAPLLYAAWAEAGAFPRERLLTLRKIDSNLEGHPTPRLPFVDAATGSLGQGLSVGVGIAVHAARMRTGQRVYVLMGDGESAEGSVWEAAQWASRRPLDNLCATIDINRLGQSEPTMLQHRIEVYKARWEAFGWQALPVDGHDPADLLDAYEKAARTAGRPTVILARTLKGKGLGPAEDHEHYHGKAFDRETADKIIVQLQQQITGIAEAEWEPNLPPGIVAEPFRPDSPQPAVPAVPSPYRPGDKDVAVRKGFGDALAALGKANARVIAIDGDVKNSTYTEEFEKVAHDRFLQGYIAEQNMVGMAMGLAARGDIPFVATFACFLTRAYDFIRMTAISNLGVKFVGTHCGISIGEDGPSQMGLEDLAMMCAQPDITVLYPSDAASAWHATWLMAAQPGPCYLRAGRPNTPVLYGPEETFAIGRCKVLRRGEHDRALIVAAGITVFEALSAYDELQRRGIMVRVIDLFSVQPIDREELIASARSADGIVITVEDHYVHGGIGDSVESALSCEGVRVQKLAVREIPRSGPPRELIEKFGISSRAIVTAVEAALI